MEEQPLLQGRDRQHFDQPGRLRLQLLDPTLREVREREVGRRVSTASRALRMRGQTGERRHPTVHQLQCGARVQNPFRPRQSQRQFRAVDGVTYCSQHLQGVHHGVRARHAAVEFGRQERLPVAFASGDPPQVVESDLCRWQVGQYEGGLRVEAAQHPVAPPVPGRGSHLLLYVLQHPAGSGAARTHLGRVERPRVEPNGADVGEPADRP